MTQEQYKNLVIEFAAIKNISKDEAAKIIINAVKMFVENTKKERR